MGNRLFSRRLRRRAAGISAVLVLVVFTAAPAQASTVTTEGTTIVLTDAIGVDNWVSVNWGNSPGGTSTVSDHAGIESFPAHCEQWIGGVDCPGNSYRLDLGAGDDYAQSSNLMAAGTHTSMLGGPGNDELRSYEGSDLLDGGPGDDDLSPDDARPSSGDVLVGGPGRDTLNLAATVAPEVWASLDGIANDGHDRTDNYGTDFEIIMGAQTARNHLLGNDEANELIGRDYDDELDGRGGRDVITAHAGDDAVMAADGVADSIDCGSGTDRLVADAMDVHTGCEQVEIVSAPRASVASIARKLDANRRRTKATIRVTCSSGSSRCVGKLQVRMGKQTLAKGGYRLRAGTKRLASVRLTRRARGVLKRRARVTVVVLASPVAGTVSRSRIKARLTR